MIYGNSYLQKEMKLSNTDSKKSKSQIVTMPALTAIATVALHRLLLLLNGSALGDSMYFLMSMSSFSILSLYKILSVVWFAVWFFRNYTMVTFAGISKNRWYLLRKINKKPSVIIMGTLAASMAVVLAQYVEGFFLSWFLAGLFGYTTHLPTLLPLFLDGLVMVTMISAYILNVSLHYPQKNDARLLTMIWLVITLFVMYSTGYNQIVHSPDQLALFTPFVTAPFFLFECAALLFFFLRSAIQAQARSSRYNVSTQFGEVFLKNPSNGRIRREKTRYRSIPKGLYRFLGSVVAFFTVIMLVLSLGLAILSSRTAQDEYSVLGYIPYTVESDQLSGLVENYDFVLFRQYEGERLKADDIVLYEDPVKEKSAIKKVVSSENGTVVLDVNVYKNGENEGQYRTELTTADIRGVMVFRSAIIGAFVILSGSTIGSVLFLAVPMFIIFFYDDIAEIARRLRYTSGKAE